MGRREDVSRRECVHSAAVEGRGRHEKELRRVVILYCVYEFIHYLDFSDQGPRSSAANIGWVP